MISRENYKSIKETLGKYPIIVVTGPRQAGKTTVLRNMFSEYRYVSLENPDIRNFAVRDPRGFMDEYDDKVIFDEIQRAPEIFSYLQQIVDDNNVMGQFILSGSQNSHLIEHITQSLAGRVAIFRLFPFQFSEMKEAGWLSNDLATVFTKGFYPAIFERKVDQDRYYADYIDTYIKRDVSQLVNVQDSRSFGNFIKLCAIRAGQLLNLNDLARDAGISHTTARNWISVLEASYILFTLQPYFVNYGKRTIKAPKLYFYDVGLLCHLLSIRKGEISPLHSMWGNIFENLIVSELTKQNSHWSLHRDYYFWRDSKGNEVDLLYEYAEAIQTYEIKSSSTILEKMFKGLVYFKSLTKDQSTKPILVFGGKKGQKRTDFTVLPWEKVS